MNIRVTPMRARAARLVANNWTMRKRYPRITKLAYYMGYDVPLDNKLWGYDW